MKLQSALNATETTYISQDKQLTSPTHTKAALNQ